MPNDTTRRIALNIPLIVLWVAAIAVAGLGYWLLQTGNAAQADFYNTQGSDYLQFLNLQTQSTLGGMLLTAGVVGVFIALAIHARNRAAAVLAANASEAAFYADELDEDDAFDGTYGAAEAQTGAVTPVAASASMTDGTTSAPAAAAAAPAETTAAPADAADVATAQPADDDTSAEPTDGTTRA